jgi:hypothetical protein
MRLLSKCYHEAYAFVLQREFGRPAKCVFRVLELPDDPEFDYARQRPS